ncbi:MAG: hypothetical protein J5995_09455 [Muribaculaceae bacterium]|nr:hypothetical protein [Muribaculaceae bacterium]
MQNQTENEAEEPKTRGYGASRMYLVITGLVFIALTVLFVFFPRSEYSELEKRDLKEFPEIKDYQGRAGEYTAAVSSWFSDTEPYRDELMTLSMNIRSAMRGNILPEEETVSFRPSEIRNSSDKTASASTHQDEDFDEDGTPAGEEEDGETGVEDDGVAKLGDAGTIIIGKGDKVRALMAFGGTSKGGGGYVSLLNTLAETFPSQRVYAMVAPLATEYYLPAKAAKVSNPQKPFIYSIRDRLNGNVKFVDIYDELLKHKDEDIYLRTDHHWSALGGYYAAKRLAQAAGVPFKGLEAYDKHVIKNFVGSMYGYSKDISVKNSPEDFVFYTPKDVKYESEFVAYTLNKNFKIVRESKPYKSSFFKNFKNGSGNAYLSFIGSDQVFVKVKTGTPGNRRLLVIKDSYGNAVPGNLFYSFNEVHVVDFRYFTHNLKKYVEDNHITDIAVCFNVFNAYSSGSASKVKTMLTQAGGIPAVHESASEKVGNENTDRQKKAAEPKVKEEEASPVESVPVQTEPESSPAENENEQTEGETENE